MGVESPQPTDDNVRYSGYLYKLGERNKKWKRRFVTIDSRTGWLYWWSDPTNGHVLGGFPLSEATFSTLPGPLEFRLSRLASQRDFRCEAEDDLKEWMRHLSDEITVRSNITKSQ